MSYRAHREKKIPTKTILSVATARIVIKRKDVASECRHVMLIGLKNTDRPFSGHSENEIVDDITSTPALVW